MQFAHKIKIAPDRVLKRNPAGFRGEQSFPQAFARKLLRLLFCGRKSARICRAIAAVVLRQQNRTQNNVLKRNPAGFRGEQSSPQAFVRKLLRLLYLLPRRLSRKRISEKSGACRPFFHKIADSRLFSEEKISGSQYASVRRCRRSASRLAPHSYSNFSSGVSGMICGTSMGRSFSSMATMTM